MASKSTPAAEPTVPNNLRIWDVLKKTDPRHTKSFSRGGGFKGTAVKPIWQIEQLTRMFGPCGVGWGFDKPEFQIVDGHGVEKLVYCTVSGWYIPDPAKPDDVAHVFGVGGDKVIAQFSNKVANDDEAFKKAFTDAIGNAFKFIGIAADVHMGQFDDSKYVQDLQAEFVSNEDTLGKKADELSEKVKEAPDLDALTALRPELEAIIAEFKEAKREGEAATLATIYKARRSKLAPPPKAVPPNEGVDLQRQNAADAFDEATQP
jgi:hypothetical protein